MMQNAFANASFSLLVGKIQGTIVDYLMPPLVDRRAASRDWSGAAVTRAFLVGLRGVGWRCCCGRVFRVDIHAA